MAISSLFRQLPVKLSIALCLICGISQVSCSASTQKPTEKTVQMPVEYPKNATEILKKLSAHVPANPDMLAFASYGSLADSIIQFQKWNLVDTNEVEKLLTDLGTHYLLNPASLTSYYKAGMNTGSGFVAGWKDKNAFVLLDVLDAKQFRVWWDNFMNEEFGRPRYEEITEDGRTFVKIQILNRDFATLSYAPDKPVLIVFGEGMVAGSESSSDTARKWADEPMMSAEEAGNLLKNIKSSPIAMVAGNPAFIRDKLPEKYRSFSEFAKNAGLEIDFSQSGPQIQLSGEWADTRGIFIAKLLDGAQGNWQNAIIQSRPTTTARVLFNSEKLESFLLPLVPANLKSDYEDIKDKLTQRVFKLNVTEQIIYNMGAAWVALYGASVPEGRDYSLTEILTAQKAAVFLPFRDSTLSDAFFAKVNILKGFVSSGNVQIELEDGVLHATTHVSGKLLHVAYYDGLLVVSTDGAWKDALGIIKSKDAKASDSVLADEKHFLVSSINVADVTTILGARYAIIKEQIGNFLKPFDSIEIQSSVNAKAFDASVKGILK